MAFAENYEDLPEASHNAGQFYWGRKNAFWKTKVYSLPSPILSSCRAIRQACRASRVGRTANQIDAKIDEIIDFAEIWEFIAMPVQSYSSGRSLNAEV